MFPDIKTTLSLSSPCPCYFDAVDSPPSRRTLTMKGGRNMQDILLLAAVAAEFIFGYLIAKRLDCFFDWPNQN